MKTINIKGKDYITVNERLILEVKNDLKVGKLAKQLFQLTIKKEFLR